MNWEGSALGEDVGRTEAEGLAEPFTDAEGEATFGLTVAEAEGLGSSDGDGETEGITTTSGDGVGSVFEVTLSRSQTK